VKSNTKRFLWKLAREKYSWIHSLKQVMML
jgi:hypothetical protein